MIPANDDAIRAVKLLAGKMADAVLEGKAGADEEAEGQEGAQEAAAEAPAAEVAAQTEAPTDAQ